MNDSFNPYLPPKANVEGVEAPREIEPVSKWLRFATFFIDYIVNYAVGFGVMFSAMVAFGATATRALEGVSGILFGVILWFCYYVLFEGIWGRTPGKFVCGTVVVSKDGTKPTLGRIALRTVCRLIPFEPFSFFGERGWHDSLSDTYVVSARG